MRVYRISRDKPFKNASDIAGPCHVCNEPMRRGEYLVRVPIGCGSDPAAREAAIVGSEFEAITILCHFPCVTGRETPTLTQLEQQTRIVMIKDELKLLDRVRAGGEVALLQASGLDKTEFEFVIWQKISVLVRELEYGKPQLADLDLPDDVIEKILAV